MCVRTGINIKPNILDPSKDKPEMRNLILIFKLQSLRTEYVSLSIFYSWFAFRYSENNVFLQMFRNVQ